MAESKSNYKVSIPIIRKKYDETSSAKFKGFLHFISNKHGVIFDWRIEFTSIHLDLYTTASWFKNENINFQRRTSLFNILGFTQEQRPTQSSNKILKLTDEQLLATNNFFNDRSQYDSTVKNIVGILKGNNPGGEAAKPQSAEMVMNNDHAYKNFVILIDHLTRNKDRISYAAASINVTEISIISFIKLNDHINNAFKYMQEEKDIKGWSHYLKGIKDYYRQYNIDVTTANTIASRARSRYSRNIENYIKGQQIPFGFKDSLEFQKCHIYEYHSIKELIIDALRKYEPTKKYEKMIEDYDNFIPLTEEVHRKFDQHYFTYTEEGDVYPLNPEGKKYVEDFMNDNMKRIPKWFLNKNKINYIRKRNIAVGLKK